MHALRSAGTLGAAVLLASLGAPPPPAGAQAGAEPARPHKSVYGTLEKADATLGGVFMKSDKGERLAWRFPAAVVTEVAKIEAGHPMIVIYRQISPSEKRVTAVAFPGAASSALYVNMTGARVMLRSAPATGGECGQADAGSVTEQMIPVGGMGEAGGACWCCAAAGGSCIPGNKTGIGKAFLVSCFE